MWWLVFFFVGGWWFFWDVLFLWEEFVDWILWWCSSDDVCGVDCLFCWVWWFFWWVLWFVCVGVCCRVCLVLFWFCWGLFFWCFVRFCSCVVVFWRGWGVCRRWVVLDEELILVLWFLIYLLWMYCMWMVCWGCIVLLNIWWRCGFSVDDWDWMRVLELCGVMRFGVVEFGYLVCFRECGGNFWDWFELL